MFIEQVNKERQIRRKVISFFKGPNERNQAQQKPNVHKEAEVLNEGPYYWPLIIGLKCSSLSLLRLMYMMPMAAELIMCRAIQAIDWYLILGIVCTASEFMQISTNSTKEIDLMIVLTTMYLRFLYGLYDHGFFGLFEMLVIELLLLLNSFGEVGYVQCDFPVLEYFSVHFSFFFTFFVYFYHN
jgi:hypothetical protein